VLKIFISIVLAVFRAQRQPTTVVFLSIINFTFTVALILFFVVVLKTGLLGAIYGQVLGLGIVVLIFFKYVRKIINFKYYKTYTKGALLFILPLVPHALAGWVINLSDRILIERFCTLEDLAIYGLAYQLALALDILTISINQAWVPFFYSNAPNPQKSRELQKSGLFYFLLVLSIGLSLSLFSREITVLVGGNSYSTTQKIFPLIILAFVLRPIYFIFSPTLFYKRKTKLVPLITITAGIINVGFNLIFIPKIGYIAAAYSTILSYAILALMSYLLAKKYFLIPFQFRKATTTLLIAIILYLTSLINLNIPYPIVLIEKFLLVVSFPVFLLIFRILNLQEIKDFKNVLSQLLSKSSNSDFNLTKKKFTK
jgi:O-antigen/teichoic acid export membrane protein